MKKTLLLVLALILSMSVVLCACGAKDDGEIIRSFIKEAQEQLDEQTADLADTMTIELQERNGALVYAYTYLMDIPAPDLVAEQLEQQVDTLGADVEPALEALAEEGVKSPCVIIEFFTKDGDLIFEHEYR